ncbi:MAG TPA: hypothetical protein VNH11_17680 [Pirellulales bacterium]|nr:hypothetical protein [Pirellulales bacterium]
MAGLAAARQELRLARRHYQQALRDYPSLPPDDRDDRLKAARERRQAAVERYMKTLRAH